MKNALLGLASLVAIAATAQEAKVNKKAESVTFSKEAVTNLMSSRQSAPGDESRWLNWANAVAIDEFGSLQDAADAGFFDLTNGPILFPDSLMLVEFTNGYGSWYIHGAATVIDPTASMYDYMDGVNNPGILDSVSIDYIYFRETASSVTDKLEITIIKHNEDTYTWGGTETAQSVGYTPDANLANQGTITSSMVHEIIEVDLTEADTIDGFIRSINVDVADLDLSLATGQRVGVAVRFMPGYSYNLGDTMANFNMFRVPSFEEQDGAEMTYDETFNHSYVLPSSVRYDNNANGWNGNFLPASAYTAPFQWEHHSIWMKVKSPNISTPELDKLGLSIFPNPTNGILNINADNTLETTVTVHNMLGQLITSKVSEGSTLLDITSQEAGVYFVTVKNELGSSTSRIVKK